MTWELFRDIAWFIFVVGALTYIVRTHKALNMNSEALRLMASSYKLLRQVLSRRPQRVTLAGDKHYETAVVLLDDARSVLHLCQEDLRKPSSGDLVAQAAYLLRLEYAHDTLLHKVGYTLAPAGDDPASLKRMEHHPLARRVL